MNAPKFADAATQFLGEDGNFLLFLTAQKPERCVTVDWFVDHREKILAALDRYGVVYFRNFPADSHRFEEIVDTICSTPMVYMGGVSPRRFVHGTVFTANDAPGPLTVVQHHELSYHGSSPRYVCFYCDMPPETGGATPVSDGRRYGRTMEQRFGRVLDELEEKGVIFIRNYSAANFKSWEQTWQTSDKKELERRLEANDTEFEWLADDWLRTKQRRSAIIRDPVSGERIVFASINIWQKGFVERVNQIYALPMPEDDVTMQPFATIFSDGSLIPNEFVASMDQIYEQQRIIIPYQARDFMLINNFVAAHGRTPWTGTERRVFVTMRDPVQHTALSRLHRHV